MRRLVAGLVLLLAGLLSGWFSAGVASAHPLDNLSINHYHGLRVHSDRVDVKSIVDSAEIPTLQQRPATDTDRDGTVSEPEAAAEAARRCAELAAALDSTVDGRPLRWAVRATDLTYPPGQADLPTTRLTCELSAPLDVGRPVTLSFSDSLAAGRAGWREITATGVGVTLLDPAVPTRSVSDELRRYPDDLLSTPLDVRSVRLAVAPGTAGPGAGAGVDGDGDAAPSGSGLTRGLDAATTAFTNLVGRHQLTPWLGTLAIVLSLVLGASHAALPGHGKTVIAAYLVGRRGTVRDALLVGATVTATHTAGVLVLGLAISVSSILAGEHVLRVLGAASGLLIATIGAALLRSALRKTSAHSHNHGHSHGHTHDHTHDHGHTHDHDHVPRFGRTTLIGMGVAGGLVPSPSALIVLLGAVALGRTWFGVLLVLGYGAGMAGMLTAAGLLLVKLRDRLDRLTSATKARSTVRRLTALTPALTATMVLVVGVGLAVRALA